MHMARTAVIGARQWQAAAGVDLLDAVAKQRAAWVGVDSPSHRQAARANRMISSSPSVCLDLGGVEPRREPDPAEHCVLTAALKRRTAISVVIGPSAQALSRSRSSLSSPPSLAAAELHTPGTRPGYPDVREHLAMADTRTITITVDEETHRQVCAEAEQRGLTVSELAAQAMEALLPQQKVDPDPSRDPADRESRHRRFLETVERIRADNPGFSAADNLSRDELYLERDLWRRRDPA